MHATHDSISNSAFVPCDHALNRITVDSESLQPASITFLVSFNYTLFEQCFILVSDNIASHFIYTALLYSNNVKVLSPLDNIILTSSQSCSYTDSI